MFFAHPKVVAGRRNDSGQLVMRHAARRHKKHSQQAAQSTSRATQPPATMAAMGLDARLAPALDSSGCSVVGTSVVPGAVAAGSGAQTQSDTSVGGLTSSCVSGSHSLPDAHTRSVKPVGAAVSNVNPSVHCVNGAQTRSAARAAACTSNCNPGTQTACTRRIKIWVAMIGSFVNQHAKLMWSDGITNVCIIKKTKT
jgi:hypothetical protein